MPKVVVTGANGFIGKNLKAHFSFSNDIVLETITRSDETAQIENKLQGADVVFHLAGVNRPQHENAFNEDNALFTAELLSLIARQAASCKVIIASSTQAELDNPYGKSKRAAELAAENWVKGTPHEVIVFRLPGIFGKWCRPNYNSVVATFCYNVANDISLEIRDPAFSVTLAYVDDIVKCFAAELSSAPRSGAFSLVPVENTASITLGQLAATIRGFRESRKSLISPAVGQPFVKALYSTYLSYLPEDQFSYPMDIKADNRGDLFEWIKNPAFGQIFVSTTKPGVTRGNHFHHTKTEKFLIIRGKASIRFRKIDDDKVIEYMVEGDKPTVVDIPPGYTHSLTNVGTSDLIALFWANEIFDTTQPDTQFLEV